MDGKERGTDALAHSTGTTMPTANHDEHEDTMTTKTARQKGKSMLRVPSPLSAEDEAIVTQVIDCGLRVHRELGPGFKEIIYERAYRLELDSRGMKFESETTLDVKYRSWRIPGQRIDLICGRCGAGRDQGSSTAETTT